MTLQVPACNVFGMRANETAEQREARRVKRVAARVAQEASDAAEILAALGTGWLFVRINKRYIVWQPAKTHFEAPSLGEAIAMAQAA